MLVKGASSRSNPIRVFTVKLKNLVLLSLIIPFINLCMPFTTTNTPPKEARGTISTSPFINTNTPRAIIAQP